MKYAIFSYDGMHNIGDDIQSLAAAQFLPSIDCRIPRECLNQFTAREKHLLVMNGWFCYYPENWPPSNSIQPVFFGFHVSGAPGTRDKFSSAEMVSYFKAHEPIGCRDVATSEFFRSLGVRAYYSKCLTLTFPKRTDTGQAKHGKVFVVDAPDIPIPDALAKDAVQVTQYVPPYIDAETRQSIAKQLLDLYRNQAKLVITTRLHCAMPCIAMGIPVVFFGDPTDHRISILKDIGVRINTFPSHFTRRLQSTAQESSKASNPSSPLLKNLVYRAPRPWLMAGRQIVFGCEGSLVRARSNVDWNPSPLAIEHEKASIIDAFQKALHQAELGLSTDRASAL